MRKQRVMQRRDFVIDEMVMMNEKASVSAINTRKATKMHKKESHSVRLDKTSHRQ